MLGHIDLQIVKNNYRKWHNNPLINPFKPGLTLNKDSYGAGSSLDPAKGTNPDTYKPAKIIRTHSVKNYFALPKSNIAIQKKIKTFLNIQKC